MSRKKYVVLPIEGNQGKYAVVTLQDSTFVFIGQPIKIFPTHSDIIQAFEKAQRESPDAVFKEYNEYDRVSEGINEMRIKKGKSPITTEFINIRFRRNLVRALEQFAQMPRSADIRGGGLYRYRARIFTLYGKSETYWGVDRKILEGFKAPLEEYFRSAGKPLEEIVIR